MQEFNNTTEESKLQQFNNLRNIAVWIEQYNYWLFQDIVNNKIYQSRQ